MLVGLLTGLLITAINTAHTVTAIATRPGVSAHSAHKGKETAHNGVAERISPAKVVLKIHHINAPATATRFQHPKRHPNNPGQPYQVRRVFLT